MKIPSIERCYALMVDMAMPDHIVAHSRRVCQVAMLMVDHLPAEETRVNRQLIQASALLHDITKIRSFETRENHAASGARFLETLGYPEVGAVVGQHVTLDSFDPTGLPNEAEIVNYADKRVLHDRVVPLEDRMRYIMNRYGRSENDLRRIRCLWEATETLEKKLFGFLSFSPDQLIENLRPFFTRNSFDRKRLLI